MLEKLRQRAIRNQTEKTLRSRDTSEINSKLVTLGFMVDENLMSDFDRLYDFQKSLELRPKDVKVFSFLEVKKKLPSIRQNQLNNKDFTWRGELQNQNAIEFLDTPFDVLIGMYQGKNLFMDYLVAKSKARFKVGFTSADPRLFDLILGIPPDNIRLVESELKKYITILKKKR